MKLIPLRRNPFFWAMLCLPLPAGALTPIYSFSNTPDGAFPYAELAVGGDGEFYGTTFAGGTNGGGSVFKISASGMLTPLYSFSYGVDGANPTAGLTLAANGSFYGTTFLGGTNFEDGGLFEMSSGGRLTPLYSFTNGADGANPYGALVQGSDGNLYGTSKGGGTSGHGAVFKMTTNGGFTALYSFTNGFDGSSPYAGLAQGSNGILYGTTVDGGTNGFGTVFEMTTNGGFTALYSFTNGMDGAEPVARLIQAVDGNLYGTTQSGGGSGYGVVFRISTNGLLHPLYSFTNGVDGAYPSASLEQGSDGNFYGTTQYGGGSGYGVVFRMSTAGAMLPLYSFTNGADGANPSASLVQGSDGYLYGTTQNGGAKGDGVIFKISPSPSSVFSSIAQSGGEVTLTWSTISGLIYQLQYTTNLNGGAWNNLGAPIPATSGSTNQSDGTHSGAERFYRVKAYP
jgi:uncharacterized repeat protein (TIGR03803 family)